MRGPEGADPGPVMSSGLRRVQATLGGPPSHGMIEGSDQTGPGEADVSLSHQQSGSQQTQTKLPKTVQMDKEAR